MVIKIFGGKSEGKSTIAQYLKKCLEEIQAEVSLVDEDTRDKWEDNLEVIKSHPGELKIEIKTIQYGRESLPNYAENFNQKE